MNRPSIMRRLGARRVTLGECLTPEEIARAAKKVDAEGLHAAAHAIRVGRVELTAALCGLDVDPAVVVAIARWAKEGGAQ